jgi:serine/threonine protein kinase
MTSQPFNDALGANYRLQQLIGRGASGEVWYAVDVRTGTPVAAKLLRPEYAGDPKIVGNFIRERSLLMGLRHPNVVAVQDLVAEGDRLAIIMDLVDGGSLRQGLTEWGPVPAGLALATTAAILDGLAAAHAQDIAHRDIKPDNVLLSADWGPAHPDHVRVTDFGISQLLSDSDKSSSGLLGTPLYMSPEYIMTGRTGLPAGSSRSPASSNQLAAQVCSTACRMPPLLRRWQLPRLPTAARPSR